MMKYTVNQLLEGQLVFYLALTVSIHHKDHENWPPDELLKKVTSRETKVNAEVTEFSLPVLDLRRQQNINEKISEEQQVVQLHK